MKDFDIEAYLNGELSEGQNNAFEQAMQGDEALRQEVDLHKDVLEALSGQGLREQVTAALNEPLHPEKKTNKRWFLLLLLPLIGLVCWYFSQETAPEVSTTPTTVSTPKKQESAPSEEVETTTSAPKKTETKPTTPTQSKQPKKKPQPIAQSPEISSIPPRIPPVNIRGKSEDKEAWDALMNSIWVSQFPPANTQFSPAFAPSVQLLTDKDFNKAFVRLRLLERKMPANDTVAFLKGYCLTELREGQESLDYFAKMTAEPADWAAALTWYRALDYLLIGETEKAGNLLNTMAKDANHPFQKASQNALEVLK